MSKYWVIYEKFWNQEQYILHKISLLYISLISQLTQLECYKILFAKFKLIIFGEIIILLIKILFQFSLYPNA